MLIDAVKASAEYVYVERQPDVDGNAALAAATTTAKQDQKKLFGLFGMDSGPYVGNFQWPVPHDAPGAPAFELAPMEEPSFANASVAALEVLSQNPNGFFCNVRARGHRFGQS